MKWKPVIAVLTFCCALVVRGHGQQVLSRPQTLPGLSFFKKDSSLFTTAPVRPLPSGFLSRSAISPSNNYSQHFGFFCKQEWKFEKQTNIPLRFRLGSLAQTDKLEGKH